MSPHHGRHGPHPHRFPRVSGDEPDIVSVYEVVLGFSPRERG